MWDMLLLQGTVAVRTRRSLLQVQDPVRDFVRDHDYNGKHHCQVPYRYRIEEVWTMKNHVNPWDVVPYGKARSRGSAKHSEAEGTSIFMEVLSRACKGHAGCLHRMSTVKRVSLT